MRVWCVLCVCVFLLCVKLLQRSESKLTPVRSRGETLAGIIATIVMIVVYSIHNHVISEPRVALNLFLLVEGLLESVGLIAAQIHCGDQRSHVRRGINNCMSIQKRNDERSATVPFTRHRRDM